MPSPSLSNGVETPGRRMSPTTPHRTTDTGHDWRKLMEMLLANMKEIFAHKRARSLLSAGS